MNPNVINIFSNDDLIKSIEIDHEVKNNNTNSFDELLHKVDNEKVFSEDNSLNASHDKTEVENKTSNNFNKNELNFFCVKANEMNTNKAKKIETIHNETVNTFFISDLKFHFPSSKFSKNEKRRCPK